MPKALEEALMRSYSKRKKKGALKGVSEGQYVFGSKVMQKEMKKTKGKG